MIPVSSIDLLHLLCPGIPERGSPVKHDPAGAGVLIQAKISLPDKLVALVELGLKQ